LQANGANSCIQHVRSVQIESLHRGDFELHLMNSLGELFNANEHEVSIRVCVNLDVEYRNSFSVQLLFPEEDDWSEDQVVNHKVMLGHLFDYNAFDDDDDDDEDDDDYNSENEDEPSKWLTWTIPQDAALSADEIAKSLLQRLNDPVLNKVVELGRVSAICWGPELQMHPDDPKKLSLAELVSYTLDPATALVNVSLTIEWPDVGVRSLNLYKNGNTFLGGGMREFHFNALTNTLAWLGANAEDWGDRREEHIVDLQGDPRSGELVATYGSNCRQKLLSGKKSELERLQRGWKRFQ